VNFWRQSTRANGTRLKQEREGRRPVAERGEAIAGRARPEPAPPRGTGMCRDHNLIVGTTNRRTVSSPYGLRTARPGAKKKMVQLHGGQRQGRRPFRWPPISLARRRGLTFKFEQRPALGGSSLRYHRARFLASRSTGGGSRNWGLLGAVSRSSSRRGPPPLGGGPFPWHAVLRRVW